jgi:hypothetical protein
MTSSGRSDDGARTNPSPKAAALEALIDAHALELKLPTVKARFRAMADLLLSQTSSCGSLAALPDGIPNLRHKPGRSFERVSHPAKRGC